MKVIYHGLEGMMLFVGPPQGGLLGIIESVREYILSLKVGILRLTEFYSLKKSLC